MLKKYADSVTEIASIKDSLESQKSDLEDEKANLVQQQEDSRKNA